MPAAALAAALSLVAGCSSDGSVTGTVTLDGAPVKRGTVTFHPVGGGPAAIGGIGADGGYELAIGKDRSIPVGEYVVTVDASEPVSSEAPADPRKLPAPPRRLTPVNYLSKDTSGLRVTVKSGSNVIPLELKGGK